MTTGLESKIPLVHLTCVLPDHWTVTLPSTFDALFLDLERQIASHDQGAQESIEALRPYFLDAAALAKAENVFFGALGMYESEGQVFLAQVVVCSPSGAVASSTNEGQLISTGWTHAWPDRPRAYQIVAVTDASMSIDYWIEDLASEVIVAQVIIWEPTRRAEFVDLADAIARSIRVEFA